MKGNNQKQLKFSELVIAYFKYLENSYNYKITKFTSRYVRYESKILFVDIYYERLSYEIGFEIGKIEGPETVSYPLEIVLMAINPNYKGPIFFQASDFISLEKCISDISKTVKENYNKVLQGDENLLKLISQTSRGISTETTKLYSLNPIKEKAAKAWERKKYSEVFYLYNSIANELNPLEKRKMQYAKSKISGI